jgi:hypothetical protein
MTRIVATLLIIAMAVMYTQAFTISMVPLLTRLGPFGKHYVNQFSQMSQPSLEADERHEVLRPPVAAPKTSVIKPTKFKFEYTDVHMISDCKSEIMEYVYAKSLDRGFA